MWVLWIMLGLTSVVAILLILNLEIFRKTKAERKRLEAKTTADKEGVFQKNCVEYNLTAREIEVLRLILTGHTYKSTADILFIAERTVDKHVRNIYEKTGVNNKIALINKLYDGEATR